MLDFKIHTEIGAIEFDDFSDAPHEFAYADYPVTKVTLGEYEIPLEDSPVVANNTVGYKMAEILRLKADIDVVFYGWPAGRNIVHAYIMAGGSNGPFSVSNYAEVAKAKYVGRVEDKRDFVRDLFDEAGHEWLYDALTWDEETTDKMMSGHLFYDGFVFHKD